MSKALRVIKHFFGYTDEAGSGYYDDYYKERNKSISSMPDLNGGKEFKHFHKGATRVFTNSPYMGVTAMHNTATMMFITAGHGPQRRSAHNPPDIQTSYDQYGTYQYYWNEKGEYVKEYLGGINNSKL